MSEERGGAPVSKTPDPGETVPDLNALDRDSSDSVNPPPVSTAESRAGARRRARTLRIPDDEVSRPTSIGGRSEPPPAVQSVYSPPVVATPSAPPPPPPPDNDGVALTPMRIISINPPPPETPPPPREEAAAAAKHEAAPVSTRAELQSEELIPIEHEVAMPVDEAPVEAAPSSGETIDPWDDGDLNPPAAAAPQPAAAAIRPLAPTEPEGEEVKFDDDGPAPAAAQAPLEQATDGERRSDPGAEIGVEDVVAVEHPVSTVPIANAKLIANLPPMRPRLESKPPGPPPPAKKPTQPKLARPPLVIVPPHVGTLAPASGDGPGTRRKGRLWWEDLFNDDYLRACEKLTDEQIAREVDFVEDSLGIERGGTVLDLACGTGRHAVELSRRGYEVVGFDLSLAMLARAGDEAQDRDAKLNFIQGDMREMTFDEQFDGVYCWNTSFGYFEEEKNAQVIDRIHRSLKSEGLLLLDVVNRDFLIRQSPSLAWFEGDGCVCMDEMNVDFITSRMKIKRTIMLDDGRSREIEYSLRVYSLHELGRILHEHGFKVCEVSGRIATPSVFFGNESPRTIILAEKR